MFSLQYLKVTTALKALKVIVFTMELTVKMDLNIITQYSVSIIKTMHSF